MEITESKNGKAVVFKLVGRLDSTSSTEVEKKILDTINAASKEIILNFSQLDYISSSGIRILIRCHKELEKRGGHLFLVSVPKPIENILYITGFLPYFKIFEGEQQAVDAMMKLS